MLRVRYAKPDDAEFVGQDGYIPTDVLARKIDANEVIVAESGGELVGYVRIEYLWSRLPYIALIRVRQHQQRRGVGRALIAFLEKEVSRAGHTMLLSSSQARELEPQRWHRHMGFTECGRLSGINADGEDEVFFRKELDS